MYDATLTPHATGAAAKTVEARKAPQDIVLHSSWFCPFSHRAWISLEERGIPYQYHEINPYKKDEQYERFREINPRGLVPTLESNGKAVFESLILCEFLEDAFPNYEPNLLPADPFERAHARIWLDFGVKSIVPVFFRLLQAQTADAQQKALEEYYGTLRTFAEQVRGPYFLGEQFSLVDVAIAPWVVREAVLKEKRGYDRAAVGGQWKAYADIIGKRDSVIRTTSETPDYIQFYDPYLRDKADSAIAKAVRAGGIP